MQQRVNPGDPLSAIEAGSFNTLIDVKSLLRRMAHGATPRTPAALPPDVVYVKNASGADASRYDVLGISDVIVKPSENLAEFLTRPTVVGVEPTTAHVGRFVVLIEPIANGLIGQAVAAGLATAVVEVASESDRFADVKDGFMRKLQSGSTGSAAILWLQAPADRSEEAPNEAWAIVRLGGGGGAASKTVRVTTIAENATTLGCKDIDDDGDETGDEFTVYVRSYGPTVGEVGQVQIASLYPPIDVGENIDVAIRKIYDGTDWVTDWWTDGVYGDSCAANEEE